MEYRKMGDAWVVRFDRGEEILTELAALCRKEDIRLASVEAIGAADHAVLGLYDVEAQAYHQQTFDFPMEISSLLGTVTRKSGEVYLHLHATVCGSNLTARGGHVNELRVSATCEMVLRTLPGEVGRVRDPAVGLNVFRFGE